MSDDYPNMLIVMALEIEAQGLFERERIPVLFTGIGKVNAAIALTRRLVEYRLAAQPSPRVINFGSAGSQRFNSGSLVSCTKFVQRDMDVSGLGFPIGVTPFEEIPSTLEFPHLVSHLPPAICGSGDSFDTGVRRFACDVVDMEAYALAKICWIEKTEFVCVKYITDGADHKAAESWEQNVHRAAEHFVALYRQLSAAESSRPT
jgi:adenosylhomocysteine nucleosidase